MPGMLDKYLLKQILPTMAVTLMIAAVILLLERMLRLLDIAVGNGVSTLVVFQMMFNLIPHYIGLALPVALFLGVLLAFRKLSHQSELDAILSSGIGLFEFMRAGLLMALGLMILNMILTGYLQPYSRYAYRVILFDVTSGVIESGIGEGVFTDLPNGYTIRVDRARDGGTTLDGVFAHKEEEDGHLTTLTAASGVLEPGGTSAPTRLVLFNGTRSEWTPQDGNLGTLQFERFDWVLDLEDLLAFRGRGGDERELTLSELWNDYAATVPYLRSGENVAVKLPEANDITDDAIAAEFHGRVVFSLSILFLPFLAAPLGIITRRASKSFGLVAGISILVSYHKLIEFGEAWASTGGIPAVAGTWGPFLVFAVLTTWLFRVTATKAGTSPVQAAESWVGGLLDGVVKMLPLRRAEERAS